MGIPRTVQEASDRAARDPSDEIAVAYLTGYQHRGGGTDQGRAEGRAAMLPELNAARAEAASWRQMAEDAQALLDQAGSRRQR